MGIATEQDFGREPIKVRSSDHYSREYAQSFAEKWDELIDWDRRAASEGSFFIDALRERGKTCILDVSTGTGFHSVCLARSGFEVTSVDGSPAMLVKAFENAMKNGFVLKTVHSDWRWLSRDLQGEFDAVICLGNSFTHLFDESDRRKALAEFYSVLAHDGILILDQRNYDTMLDQGFRSKHKYYYCGENVSAEPEHLDDGLARFVYSFPDGSRYHLNMCPVRREYIKKLILEAGFQHIETYGDFKEDFRTDDPDFFIHLAEKYPRA